LEASILENLYFQFFIVCFIFISYVDIIIDF